MSNILVTGTGGGAGQSILKALLATDYNVIAADGDALGAGLYMTSKGYVIPFASHPDYICRLLQLCRDENIEVLFPGLDLELPVLAKHHQEFKNAGTTVIVSDARVVEISDDKLLTSRFLEKAGFPHPQTWVLAEFKAEKPPFPVILKPRRGGASSQGIRVVSTARELATARQDLAPDAFVMQELIEGPEYTCGTLTLGGTCKGAIVLRRILRGGDTYKAFVESNSALEDFVTKVANCAHPFGPLNVQLRVRDGVPYVFEFNARCSGTTWFRALAGYNEPKMIADFVLRGMEPRFEVRPITILRYWNELVVENDLVQACKEHGLVTAAPSRLEK